MDDIDKSQKIPKPIISNQFKVKSKFQSEF